MCSRRCVYLVDARACHASVSSSSCGFAPIAPPVSSGGPPTSCQPDSPHAATTPRQWSDDAVQLVPHSLSVRQCPHLALLVPSCRWVSGVGASSVRLPVSARLVSRWWARRRSSQLQKVQRWAELQQLQAAHRPCTRPPEKGLQEEGTGRQGNQHGMNRKRHKQVEGGVCTKDGLSIRFAVAKTVLRTCASHHALLFPPDARSLSLSFLPPSFSLPPLLFSLCSLVVSGGVSRPSTSRRR